MSAMEKLVEKARHEALRMSYRACLANDKKESAEARRKSRMYESLARLVESGNLKSMGVEV